MRRARSPARNPPARAPGAPLVRAPRSPVRARAGPTMRARAPCHCIEMLWQGRPQLAATEKRHRCAAAPSPPICKTAARKPTRTSTSSHTHTQLRINQQRVRMSSSLLRGWHTHRTRRACARDVNTHAGPWHLPNAGHATEPRRPSRSRLEDAALTTWNEHRGAEVGRAPLLHVDTCASASSIKPGRRGRTTAVRGRAPLCALRPLRSLSHPSPAAHLRLGHRCGAPLARRLGTLRDTRFIASRVGAKRDDDKELWSP